MQHLSGEGAFANLEGVKKVIIPSTVKEIQVNAFRGNTTLEEVVFETEIVNGLEQGLERIRNDAFRECKNLSSIELPDTIKELGEGIFYDCYSLKTVKLSNQLTTIPNYLFNYCREIEEIIIPEGVISIGGSFQYCTNLKTIKFPVTLKSINSNVFSGCSNLENIEISSGNENFSSEGGILFNKGKTEMIYILKTAIDGVKFEVPDTVTVINSPLIDIYQQIEYVYIPAGVISLNVRFFTANKNITNIEIDENNPNYVSENGKIYNKDKTELYLYYLNEQTVDLSTENIKTIGTFAFGMFNNIETVVFPETLENINSQAFSWLSNLKNVTIGKNIKSIDPIAFYMCRNIENMTIDPENEYYTIENNTIFNKNKTELVTVLNKVTEYTIPEGVTKIGYRAFHNQESLVKIEIVDTVKEIGASFNMCGSLTQIEIPSSVETIATDCFANSNKLQKIIIHKAEGSISGSPWGCPIGLRAVEWVQ